MSLIVISLISNGQAVAHKLSDAVPSADIILSVALLQHPVMPTGFAVWEKQRIQHRIRVTRPLRNVTNGIYYFK